MKLNLPRWEFSLVIVTPQIDISIVAFPTPIRNNKRMSDQRNISPGKACWVFPFPPQKKPSRYTHSRNQTYIKNQEEERATKSNVCPKCKTKHPRQECPLNKIPPCYICMGHHIFPQGIKMDPIKIEVIIGLLSPKTLPPPDS